MYTLLLPTSFSIKGIFSAASAAASSLRDRAAAGKRKEEWITNVSVQREPSGHNLKHPTKWCPPNK